MKQSTGLIAALGSAFLASLSAEPLMLQVAPEGNLPDLRAARDAIRDYRSQHGDLPEGGVVVKIAAGIYRQDEALLLDERDSGREGRPIVWRAAEPGAVVLSGAASLSKLEPQPVRDPAILRQLQDSARSQVRVADLSAWQIEDYPGFSAGGAGFSGQRDLSFELYQNGERLMLARWPNESFAQTGRMLGTPRSRPHKPSFVEGKFHFENERLDRWAQEPDLWTYGRWYHHWADQSLPVASIDTRERTIQLANPETHAYGFAEGQDFYIFNAISEIDRPGEWALDRRNRRLYFWPASGGTTELELALTTTLIDAKNVRHVRFEGLRLHYTRGDAAMLRDCHDVLFSACAIRHTGGWGVRIYGGNDCSVVDSHLFDLGEGGVFIRAGDKRTLAAAGHLVENCHIHELGKVIQTYRPGVDLRGVGSIARHNLIHHSPHTGLMFGGNDHLIEYNIIHDVCQHTSDAGAIYACTRDWTDRGTVVRHNLVHSLGESLDNAGCRGIYLDDFTSGVHVEGNIVTESTIGIHIGGGRDNIVTNNLLLNCDTSIDYASRSTDSFASAAASARMGTNSPIYRKLLNSPWDSEPYKSSYPKIKDIFEIEDPIRAHDAAGNAIYDNIMAGGSSVVIANSAHVLPTSRVENNAWVNGDPGLVDREGLRLGLRPDAAVFQEVPGFEPLHFDAMGLLPDRPRLGPAPKFGEGVSPLPPIRTNAGEDSGRPFVEAEHVTPESISIDGRIEPGEWTTDPDNRIRCNVSLGHAESRLDTSGWVAFDGEALYLLLSIDTDPTTGWITEGNWGERDGFEIVVADPRASPVQSYLLHCFPDGSVDSIAAGYTEPEQAERLETAVEFAASVQKQRWLAELRLPLEAMSIDPQGLDSLNVNLNVRRMGDETWMAWSRPNGPIWNPANAGVVSLERDSTDSENAAP